MRIIKILRPLDAGHMVAPFTNELLLTRTFEREFDQALLAFNEADSKGGFPASRERELALVSGLQAMARLCATDLEFTHVNANGELQLIARREGRPRRHESDPAGKFGAVFGQWLTDHGVRTGSSIYGYKATMGQGDGWCHMPHFHAANMIRAFGASRAH